MPVLHKLNKDMDYLVFLVENKLTIVDIIIIPCLYNFFTTESEGIVLKLDNLIRHYDNLQHHENWRVDNLKIMFNI